MIKTLYILWFQGFNNAPEIVKKCANSWKHYNPDWSIIILDDMNLTNYINLKDHIHDISDKQINNTALSDIVRIILLKQFGGLWVDSTTFCNKPLNDWLPSYINEGFFAFSNPGHDRLLSSWFLYSDKNNYIIDKWYNETIKYYTINNTPHTYYWFHYLFGDLYKLDNAVKEIWDKVPKLSANDPHYLQGADRLNKFSIETKLNIDNKIAPLYKLTYRYKGLVTKASTLYYLYSTINI